VCGVLLPTVRVSLSFLVLSGNDLTDTPRGGLY
jgi:hypothetical protein